MAVKKILTLPDPALRSISEEVVRVDKKTEKLIKDLKDTLEASKQPKGVGLSAPQIGVLKRVMVIKMGDKIQVFVNPEIVSSSKKMLVSTLSDDEQFLEGCLSIPEVWGFVNRPLKMKVSYLDGQGEEKTGEFGKRKAVYIQHEIDHLNGVLFIDRVLKQGGKLYRLEKNDKGEHVLTEIPLVA